MNRRFYSKRHFDRISNGGPDTQDQVNERIRYRKALEQANKEMMERFNPLTPENALEAVKWQEARIKELMKG